MTALAPSSDYRRLAGQPRSELQRLFVRGETPSLEALTATEYGGWNHPRRMAVVGIRKFIKGFFRTESGDHYGYNTPARQDGLGRPWSARPDDEHPKRFGFYLVARVDPEARDNRYLHALLLDYGRGGNPAADVSRLIRDYLVRIERGSDDLLLGKAYLSLGPARAYSNFFLLQRLGPASRPPSAPPMR
jgi:hypothetical protein